MIDKANARAKIALDAAMALAAFGKAKTRWVVRKYDNPVAFAFGECREELEIEGNLLLNEGINELWSLVCGTGGVKFDNTNAYIGVGDSSTAAAATQTGLQASTNKLYKGMEASYPTYGTDQKATWRAQFGASEANFAWEEITVANGNSDASDNLNRKVQSMGTKASPAVWTVDLEITLS